MNRLHLFICPFVLAGCYPAPSSPSGPGTVHLSVVDAPADTNVTLYKGHGYRGHRPVIAGSEWYCHASPCETEVPPGSTLDVSSSEYPGALVKLPPAGGASLIVHPGSNFWNVVAPYGELYGGSMVLIGGILAGDAYVKDRPSNHGELALGWSLFGVGALVLATSIYQSITKSTRVTVLPAVSF